MKEKSYIKRFIIAGIVLVFSVSSTLSCFADPSQWGVDGNQISFDVTSGPGNSSNITVNGQTVNFTPGTSFSATMGNLGSLNTYITNNMVQVTDWGDFATSVGTAVATAYVGSIIGGAVSGGFSGYDASGWSGVLGGMGSGAWNSATLGATAANTANAANAANTASSVSTLSNMSNNFLTLASTSLLAQSAGTATSLICADHDLSTKETYIWSAAAGSLISFGYGGGMDTIAAQGCDSVLGNTAATLVNLGAPVLGAWTVTSLADDEDIENNEVDPWILALGSVVSATTSNIALAMINPNSGAETGLYERTKEGLKHRSGSDPYANDSFEDYQARENHTSTGETYGEMTEAQYNREILNMQTVGLDLGYDFDGASSNTPLQAADSSLNNDTSTTSYSDTSAAESHQTYGSIDPSNTPYETSDTGTTTPTVNSGTGEIIRIQGPGFDSGRYFTNVFANSFADGFIYGLGSYLNASATQGVSDYLEDQWGEDHWGVTVVTSIVDYSTKRLWPSIVEASYYLNSKYWLGSSVDQDYWNLRRLNSQLAAAKGLHKQDLIDSLPADVRASLGEQEYSKLWYAYAALNLNEAFGLALDPSNTEQINATLSYLAQLADHNNDTEIDLANTLGEENANILSNEETAREMRDFVYKNGNLSQEFRSELDNIANGTRSTDDKNFYEAVNTIFDHSWSDFSTWFGNRSTALAALDAAMGNGFTYDNKAYSGGEDGDIYASGSTSDMWAQYDRYLNTKAHDLGYGGFMNSLGYSNSFTAGLDIYGNQLWDQLVSSTISGITVGGVNALYNKYVKQEWLHMDRYDDAIDNLSSAYDALAANPNATININNLDLTDYQRTTLATYYSSLSDSDLTAAQAQIIKTYVENDDLSYSDLPDSIKNTGGAQEYYNALDTLDSRHTYVSTQRYKLNIRKQPDLMFAAFGANLATSAIRGVTNYLGWTYTGGQSLYEYTAYINRDATEQLGIASHLAGTLGVKGSYRWAPYKWNYVLNGDDRSELINTVSNIEDGKTFDYNAVIIRGYETTDSSKDHYYAVPRDAWNNNRDTLPSYIRDGDPVSASDIGPGNHTLDYVIPAVNVPMVMDIYNQPGLWDSIITSTAQSMVQAISSGLSLGRTHSFTGKNITGADLAAYNSNMLTHIRSAANGFSIAAGALTTSNLTVAGNNLAASLAAFPMTADLFGLKYTKLVKIVNAKKPHWVYSTFEFSSPTLNQRAFLTNDINLGIRRSNYDAVKTIDFLNDKAVSH